MRSISVVIPNFNGRHLLEANLPSVFAALANVGSNGEVIVADDASTDGSVEFLRQHYPSIILVEHHVNQGFSANINNGFRVATKDLVLALNNDVVLDAFYFRDQLPLFENPDVFGTMGSIWEKRRNGEMESVLIDGSKLPIYNGISFSSTANVHYPSNPDSPLPTFFLSGANALVHRKKLNELGGMNEVYSPFYMEDVDLSLRAWRMGWQCVYVPSSACIHAPSSTIASSSSKRRVRTISRCNKMLFHLFHLQGAPLLRYQCYLAVNFMVRWVMADIAWYAAFRRMLALLPRLSSEKATFSTKNPKNTQDVHLQILRELRQNGRVQF